MRLFACTLFFVYLLAVGTSIAKADQIPKNWHAPSAWLVGATCIHQHESGDWNYGPSHHPSTRTWNGYYNGYQFLLSTWLRAEKLSGVYADVQWAPIRTQVFMAYTIWKADGESWSEWGTRGYCGL